MQEEHCRGSQDCKLNVSKCPEGEKEKAKMRKVPYALAIGSLMYAMVCTRPAIPFVVGAQADI